MARTRERLFADAVVAFDIVEGVARMEFATFSNACRDNAGRAAPYDGFMLVAPVEAFIAMRQTLQAKVDEFVRQGVLVPTRPGEGEQG